MKQFIAAALVAMAPLAAQAHDVTLEQPGHGATLNESGVDLSVHWLAVDGGAEVSATYVSSWDKFAPARVAMLLNEGDATTFSMPDARQVAFRFAFENGALRVTAQPLTESLASR